MAKKNQKKRRQYGVPAEQFISTWREVYEADEDVNEFCKRANMPKDIVYARASEYRLAGIRLPKLRRANAAASGVERLNDLLGVAERDRGTDVVDRLLKMVADMPD